MAKGGFPGMGNMGGMMKQVQKMQKQMEELQAQLEEKEVEASAGGGAVVAVANGKKQIVSITIDKDVVDPDDVDMLEDLVMAAVNEALRSAEDYVAKEMSKITGGMNIPGMF